MNIYSLALQKFLYAEAFFKTHTTSLSLATTYSKTLFFVISQSFVNLKVTQLSSWLRGWISEVVLLSKVSKYRIKKTKKKQDRESSKPFPKTNTCFYVSAVQVF